MHNDLISRKPLVDMLQGVEDNIFAEATREVSPTKAFIAGVVQEIKNQVIDLPAVETVPVVRCKECIFRGQWDLCPMCVRVYALDEAAYLDCTEEDGFCHKGKKLGLKEE